MALPALREGLDASCSGGLEKGARTRLDTLVKAEGLSHSAVSHPQGCLWLVFWFLETKSGSAGRAVMPLVQPLQE